MKLLGFLTVLTCLALLGCESAKDDGVGVGQQPAKQIEPEGLWILDIDQPGPLDVMEIINRGAHYVMRVGSEFGTVAHVEGDVLVTKQPEGDVTFSADASIARFNGKDYRRTTPEALKSSFPEHYERMYRSKCIDRIHKIQIAVRRHEVRNEMHHGDPLEPSFLVKNGPLPSCPGGGTYNFMRKVPEPGVLYCTCSHAKDKGHVPEDHSGW